MKRFLLSTFALSLLAFAPAAFAAAPIDPALVKEMDAAGASGTHDVTAIVLCDQELSRRGLHGTAGEVKRALETHANRTQAGVLQDCKNIWVYPEPLWIVNGMIVKTSALQIRRIAEFKGVRAIRANRKHSLPKTVAAPVKDSVGPYVWSQMNMNVPAARETYGMTGAGVLVGQLDTGMFEEHVDLKGKVYAWKDFIKDKPKPYDDHSHGTHTGGSILGGNGSGKWIGGAPDAKIAVAKIFSASGSADDAGILKAMQWIMDPDGNPETNDAPRVVNNSWGDDNVSFELRPAVQAWVAANMFPAFSNGNSGPSAGTVGSPAAYEESFGVGAASSNFSIAYFSSRGPAKYEGKVVVKPDITGPGASVISSMPNGKWSSMSGTSMSCPSVVGVIALLYQAKPDITIAEVRAVLESTAKPAGAEGKDNVFGSGHVDAKAALAKVLGKTNASKPEINAADRVIEALEKAPTAAVKDGARFLRDRLMMIEDPAAKAKIARLTDLLR